MSRKMDMVTGKTQKILVFQQNGCAESKIDGIRRFGQGLYELEIVSIDEPLPPILDETDPYLPSDIRADLVLDFLKHPDLAQDLARLCSRLHIPVVASGKKWRIQGTLTPPT